MKKIGLFSFIGLFSLLFLSVTPVEATNENTPPSHIELDQIFQTPVGSVSQVIPTVDGDIVQLTDAIKNQNGAIWSTDNNRMDLSADFEASMYIYFGNQGTTAADGMAFVMQNDARRSNTIISGEGAQLGVWDSASYGKWGQGIQNSFAVEFDTYNNGDGEFDGNVKGDDHIAWNYPSLKSSYEDYVDWLKPKRKLAHNDVQYPGELSTDQWIPFTIKWSAATQTLTYQFNNMTAKTIQIDTQKIFGTTQVYWGFTGSTGAQIEMNRVVFEKVPGLVNAEVKETITNQAGISMEGQVAGIGEQLTYRIEGKYLSGKQNWKEILAELQISDSVNYVPGTLRGKLAGGTEISLPDSFWNDHLLNVPVGTLSQGDNLAYVTFDVETVPVTTTTLVSESSSFKGKNRIEASNLVSYAIQPNQAPVLTLENENTIQKIATGTDYEVKGTWKDPDGTTEILHYLVNGKEISNSTETSQVVGQEKNYDYLIPAKDLQPSIENVVEVFGVDAQGAETQHLSLKVVTLSAPVITLNGANTTVNLDNGSGYTLQGTWKDADSQWVSLYYILDNQAPIQFAKEITNSMQETAYNWNINAADLPLGTHQLNVYGEDTEGQQSNIATLTLSVTGELQFTNVSDQVSYETKEIPQSTTTAKRNNDWDIRVKDTRGVGSEWHVDVTLEKLFTNQQNQSLNEALVYKDSSTESLLQVGIATTVYTKKTTDGKEVPIDWKEDQGLLMKVHSSDYAGTYQGTLNWTLVDGP
ncbi:hypothetical protein GZ789_001496 [Enterococcus faecalis]|nr:hypothetical protein [Enterococcus faecalis]